MATEIWKWFKRTLALEERESEGREGNTTPPSRGKINIVTHPKQTLCIIPRQVPRTKHTHRFLIRITQVQFLDQINTMYRFFIRVVDQPFPKSYLQESLNLGMHMVPYGLVRKKDLLE